MTKKSRFFSPRYFVLLLRVFCQRDFEASAGQGLLLNDFGSEIAAFSNSYDRICKYFPHFPGILEPFKNAYGFLFHSVATEH